MYALEGTYDRRDGRDMRPVKSDVLEVHAIVYNRQAVDSMVIRIPITRMKRLISQEIIQGEIDEKRS